MPSAIVKVLAYALCILLGFIVFLLGSDVFFFFEHSLTKSETVLTCSSVTLEPSLSHCWTLGSPSASLPGFRLAQPQICLLCAAYLGWSFPDQLLLTSQSISCALSSWHSIPHSSSKLKLLHPSPHPPTGFLLSVSRSAPWLLPRGENPLVRKKCWCHLLKISRVLLFSRGAVQLHTAAVPGCSLTN